MIATPLNALNERGPALRPRRACVPDNDSRTVLAAWMSDPNSRSWADSGDFLPDRRRKVVKKLVNKYRRLNGGRNG
jgi:hypothetical protein